MAVTRLIDKVYAEVAALLRSRATEDDVVLLDTFLTQDEDGIMLGVYATLDCPETNSLARSCILIDVGKYASFPEVIAEVADDMWESMVCARMGQAVAESG